jgi:hypothetical protein
MILFGKFRKIFYVTTAVCYIILLILTSKVTIREINAGINRLSNKIHKSQGAGSLNLKEKIGVYGLNIIMGLAAFPVYPEASLETLFLIFPAPKGESRIFHSNFAERSDLVRQKIDDFNKLLKTRKKDIVLFGPERLNWRDEAYKTFGSEEARVALALNSGDLTINARRSGVGWKELVSIRVKVKYLQYSRTVLLSDPELIIDEGLFRVLEECGWLYPYYAVWVYEKEI